MKRKTALLLGTLVVASGVLSSLMLTRGHAWGDDFAGYILQAQSIDDGQVSEFIRRNTLAVTASAARFGPVTYPWGFPLLLAPAYAIFGLNLLALKLLITICYMAFLPAFYGLARRMLGAADSLLLTAVLAVQPGMLEAQNHILADIPFLFLSTLGLYLITGIVRQEPGPGRVAARDVLLGLVICAAATTRWNGFLLLLPLAAAQWIGVRDQSADSKVSGRAGGHVAMPYLVFALGFAIQAVVFPSSRGGWLEQSAILSLQTIRSNLAYYFWLPSPFFVPFLRDGRLAYLAAVLFFGVGAARSSKSDWPILLYASATVCLFVLFPATQGLRYLYPILPILLLFVFRGMKLAAGLVKPSYRIGAVALVYLFWIASAIHGLGTNLVNAGRNIAAGRSVPGGWQTGPLSPASESMFAFIRESTPADSTVIFFKPRAMRLFTDRDSFVTSSCEALVKGDYIVLVNDNDLADQIAPDAISQCEGSVQVAPVYRQQGFMVYRILRSP